MFIYVQSTGEVYEQPGIVPVAHKIATLSAPAKLLGIGYSGHGAGRNNPSMEDVHNIGPIPCGVYMISKPECVTPAPPGPHGPYIMRLSPVGHNSLGRSGFLIHGDNVHHDASQGCIILLYTVRLHIGTSVAHILTVVSAIKKIDMWHENLDPKSSEVTKEKESVITVAENPLPA